MKKNCFLGCLFLLVLSFFTLFLPKEASAVSCGINLGNLTISAGCTVAADGLEGCDKTLAEDSTNTCTLTLSTGGDVILLSGVSGTTKLFAGKVTLSGGGIALGTTASNLKVGDSAGIWVRDEDADGYALNFSYATATNSVRRRFGLMKSDTETDCDDLTYSATNTCYSYSQSAYYRYAQSAYYRYGQMSYYRYSQMSYYRYSQSGYQYQCFTAKTRVLMADGTYKEIQDIKAGDIVVSYNLDRKERVHNVVKSLIIHPAITGGEKLLLINGKLEITAGHNVWSPNKNKWLRIDKLSVGDTLLNPQGEEVRIDSVKELPTDNIKVYNLEIYGSEHNYFTEDMLVHNAWKT